MPDPAGSGGGKAPDVRLVLPGRPEHVAVVRQALSAVARTVGIDDRLLADVKIAVSEACNNVVLHAYGGAEGPLEVYVCPDGTELSVVVRDMGGGIQPRAPQGDEALQGVGLSLIQALTESAVVQGRAQEGTEVRMTFRSEVELDAGYGPRDDEEGPVQLADDGAVSVSAQPQLIGPVLSAVLSMIAANEGFTVERLLDVQLVADAIAAHAPAVLPSANVCVTIAPSRGDLGLCIGPLAPGGAEGLVTASAVAGMDPILSRLARDVSTRAANEDGGELLLLRLTEPA